MLALYRSFLRLYPANHRREFGSEMISVLCERRGEAMARGAPRSALVFREIVGLLGGALSEHVRALSGRDGRLSLPIWRFNMQASFRFPKSTPALMMIILAGVIVAIEKARAIQASLPDVNPPIGAIHPIQHTFLPGVVKLVLFFYAIGVVGWAIVYALRRSGIHRLADMSVDQK